MPPLPALPFYSLQLCSDSDKVKVSTVSLGFQLVCWWMCVTHGLTSGTLPNEKWGLYHRRVMDLSVLLLLAVSDAVAPFVTRWKWSTKLSLLIVCHNLKCVPVRDTTCTNVACRCWCCFLLFFEQSFTLSFFQYLDRLLFKPGSSKKNHALMMLIWYSTVHVKHYQHWLAFQRRLCMPVFIVRPGQYWNKLCWYSFHTWCQSR